jgi:hypothetical protein
LHSGHAHAHTEAFHSARLAAKHPRCDTGDAGRVLSVALVSARAFAIGLDALAGYRSAR